MALTPTKDIVEALKVSFSRPFFAQNVAGNWGTVPSRTALPAAVSFSPEGKIVSIKVTVDGNAIVVPLSTLSFICISFELE